MILITGANGQLGQSLQNTLPAKEEALFVTREQLDISNSQAIEELFKNYKINTVINCAAYTLVDKAEKCPELAELINKTAVENIARVAKKYNAKLIHISTDYVFDGEGGTPYSEGDQVNPQSVYGKTKLAGELVASEILGADVTIIRTSWLYSSFRSNFVKTILKLLRTKESINVVKDQVGAPTWSNNLAEFLWLLSRKNSSGILHFTDGGQTSWYEFAKKIQDEALKLELVKEAIQINPILSKDYPQAAQRPKFSKLNTDKVKKNYNNSIKPWEQSLVKMLTELKDTGI